MAVQVRFYWDIFLILNFIMNLFLLGMTGILRRKRILIKKLIVAAGVGSAVMTAVYSLYLAAGFHRMAGKWLLFTAMAGISWWMLCLAYKERERRERCYNFFGLIQVSIITGGSILFLQGQLQRAAGGVPGAVCIFAGTLLFFVVLWLGRRYYSSVEKQRHVVDGLLTSLSGKSISVRVLIDTGNQLVSPYSGEAVMIISSDVTRQLQVEENQNPLWIPYHSIGGDGVLPAYRFQQLQLSDGQCCHNFLAAVTDRLTEDKRIQMIVSG